MDVHQIVTALQTLFVFCGLLLLWNVLWPRLVINAARQHFFALRDELFLIALRQEGEVRFDTPAYQRSRRQINSLINTLDYLHVWMLLTLSVGMFGLRRRPSLPGVPSDDPDLSAEGKAALALNEKRMAVALGKYLALRTPLSSLVLLGLFAAGVVAYLCARAVRRVVKQRTFSNPYASIAAVGMKIGQAIAGAVEALLARVPAIDAAVPWRHPARPAQPDIWHFFLNHLPFR